MFDQNDPNLRWATLKEHNSVLRHDMATLRKLLSQISPSGGIFIDLGCFIGGFTVPLAQEAAKRGGKVFSIDLYKRTAVGLDFWNEHLRYPCKEFFIDNMTEEGVLPYINLNEGCSWDMAAYFPDESVDFIWIDASHKYKDVIRDIRAWWPKLKTYGIMAGHDYSDWGVEMAVREFFDEYTVYPTRNDCWSVRKV